MRHEASRSSASRAADLGSAKQGVEAWRAERVTAIALVPLSLWLVASLVALSSFDRMAFRAWLGRPLSALLMVLLLIAAFRHAALGLEVVVEDYIHSVLKIPLLVTTRVLCFVVCTAGVLATLSVALGR